jgi:hypothetical protein
MEVKTHAADTSQQSLQLLNFLPEGAQLTMQKPVWARGGGDHAKTFAERKNII